MGEEERRPIVKELNYHITEEQIQRSLSAAGIRHSKKSGVEMWICLSAHTPRTDNKAEGGYHTVV